MSNCRPGMTKVGRRKLDNLLNALYELCPGQSKQQLTVDFYQALEKCTGFSNEKTRPRLQPSDGSRVRE